MLLSNLLSSLLCMCSTFTIQMYWERGYNWQGREFEINSFCWTRHYFGLKSLGVCYYSGRIGLCWPDAVYITTCKLEDPGQMWTFTDLRSGEYQIRAPATGLCLERITRNGLRMRPCDSSNSKQRFYTPSGSRRSNKFSIGQDGMCLGQDHHPKNGEVIEMEDCGALYKDNTMYMQKGYY
jgi:hypothetical protein